MANIQDIAKATGYSVTTVSKAFNNYKDISDKAKKIILTKADEMGYFPNAQARGLKMKRSFTIGVILDELLGLGLAHPFFSNVIQSFRIAVEAKGYSMILISNNIGDKTIESYISHCKHRDVDAVFILCTDKKDEGIKELIHSDIPTVLFDMPDDDTSCVITNHYQGAFEAVEYLHNLGHSRIAHIYGSQLIHAGAERRRGYSDAMAQFGLDINPDYLVNGGYFDLKYGKKAMETLLDLEERPTAVFVSGDMMALGAIQTCYERGIAVPEEISIIGFDNLMVLDWIKPSLTTVAQDYDAIGETCSNMIVEMIENKEIDKHRTKIINTRIIERSSCMKV